jgi:alpha-ketoglutarate-dependent taurine dioxygenase|tara:strand:- start:1539 stop:2399 length:861 start_codon:yes stop_codon:yes gene_type:complete
MHVVNNIDEVNASSIRQLVGEHRTVVIKNKNPVSPEKLIAFYKELGNVVKQNDKVTGTIATGELVRVRQNGLFAGKDDGELEWHSAGMNRTGHDDIVAMYMNQPAESGGDTHFTDHQSAWQDLDDETKDLCRKLKSKVVTYNATMKLEKMHYKNVFSDEQTMMEFRDIDGKTSFEKQTPRKDLVTKHPINGKEGLYFPWSVIRGFAGLDHKEQHDLYYMLKSHTLQYTSTHTWDAYDIVLSDQHHSLHKRDAYVGDRELWRAGICLRPKAEFVEEWTCESLMSEAS